MPAPQASLMKQLARATFQSFAIQVPARWQNPTGQTEASHYSNTFEPAEKTTAAGQPSLVGPSTANKYHTDAQKMHVAKLGKYIDGVCSAICDAMGKWQQAASMAGIVISGPVASGGMLVGPPLQPMILASAPKATAMEAKYSNVIATVVSSAWLAHTSSATIPGLPLYPGYAAITGPAPPIPNAPLPFKAIALNTAPLMKMAVKQQMVAQLADPNAPLHAKLFECIADAFEKIATQWAASAMIRLTVVGVGSVPPAPPIPVVGTATMLPGGIS